MLAAPANIKMSARLVAGDEGQGTNFPRLEKKKTDLNMGLVLVAHGQPRELSTDLDHGIVKDGRKCVIIVKSLDCFLDEVKTYSTIIHGAPEQIGSNGVMLWVRFAAEEESIRYEK